MEPIHPSIAFLEKVFLKKRQPGALLRGVELFNLNLIDELSRLGYGLVIAAHPTWRQVFEERFPGNGRIRPIYPAPHSPPFLGAVSAAFAFRRIARREGPFHTLLIGNAGNGIVPAIRLLRSRKTAGQSVIISHREPQPLFLKAVTRLPGHILAVCGAIADDYRVASPIADVRVFYGIMEADRFHPAQQRTRPDDVIRFCVLGALDNGWKGADTAIEAFRSLPDGLRSKAELHLMAYSTPPSFPDEPAIRAYSWCDSNSIPDFLRSMDVMIVPSRDEEVMRETFSQATVQGMLTALPILHSPLPVLVEKFDQGGGILFQDAAALAAAMERLATDPALREEMGNAARKTALERYVWDTRRFCEEFLS